MIPVKPLSVLPATSAEACSSLRYKDLMMAGHLEKELKFINGVVALVSRDTQC